MSCVFEYASDGESRFVDAVLWHCQRIYGSVGDDERVSRVGVAVDTYRRVGGGGGGASALSGVREVAACHGKRCGELAESCGNDLRADIDGQDAWKDFGTGVGASCEVQLSKSCGSSELVASSQVLGDVLLADEPVVVPRVFGQLPRGPNYERNRLNRLNKKRRKNERRGGVDVGACGESRAAAVREAGVAGVELDSENGGFWNSCSAQVRQQLIDSKAKMHIAENLRRAKESDMRCHDMDSPYAIMQKVVKMAEYAEKQAVKENNDRVYGWAKTVATSSAESLAKSVPSSVPSFRELEEKLAASSQSSFELELAKKDNELDEKREKISDLEMVVAELKLAKGIIDGSKDHYNVPKLEQPVYSVVTKPKKSSGFVKTKKQPWPHVQIGRHEAHAEY